MRAELALDGGGQVFGDCLTIQPPEVPGAPVAGPTGIYLSYLGLDTCVTQQVLEAAHDTSPVLS